jgi:hypothetical protein
MSNVNVKSKYTNSIKSAVILVTLNTGTCSLNTNLIHLLRIKTDNYTLQTEFYRMSTLPKYKLFLIRFLTRTLKYNLIKK